MSGALRATRTLNGGLRASGLLVVAALVLHWSRYLLAYGASAESELHRQGHGYLVEFVPVFLVAGIALVLAAFAVRFAWLGAEAPSRGLAGTVGTYAALLLVLFTAQELAELLFTEQRSAWQAVCEQGGWLSLPLAMCLGWVLALVDARLSRTETRLVAWFRSTRGTQPVWVVSLAHLQSRFRIASQGQLAFGWARRPPPQLP